jgi:putative endonuclease
VFVYILGCEEEGNCLTYVGWTNDLVRRLKKHNAGAGAKTTRGRFWVLLYAEKYKTRREAMSREWHLKRDRAFRNSLRRNRYSTEQDR